MKIKRSELIDLYQWHTDCSYQNTYLDEQDRNFSGTIDRFHLKAAELIDNCIDLLDKHRELQ